MLRYELGKRDLNARNHWIDLYSSFRITKPSVICLGGNGTTSSRKINHYCKMVQNLIGLKTQSIENELAVFEQVDLLGINYGLEDIIDLTSDFTEDDINEIVDNLLYPLCVDENGNAIELEKACKNISLITFFTHSHGAEELCNLTKNLKDKLTNIGYLANEIDEILSNMYQISYAPATNETYLPTIRVDSFKDRVLTDISQIFKDTYGYDLDGVAIKLDNAGTFRNTKFDTNTHDILSIYSSQLINNEFNFNNITEIDEHPTDFIVRNAEWELEEAKAKSAKNADVVSQMIAYALARCVANSIENHNSSKLIKKPSLQELANELEDIKNTYSEEELMQF